MNSNILQALQYVKNTNGGATKAHFYEDHEPIGDLMWQPLIDADYVRTDENSRIFLTVTGELALQGKK